MLVLQARNINKSYGDKQILKAASFSVNENERLGLVGSNGCGKTTFIKCLNGSIQPDSGDIIISPQTSMACLQQLPDYEEGLTIWELVMDSFAELIEKRRMLRELEVNISRAEENMDSLLERYARLNEEYEMANGYACENVARRILIGLGFNEKDFNRDISSLSGGQKTRLNLARLLTVKPDILVLDEPTNHLDINSVEWLEDYLQAYTGTVIVVSHDRMFLERVATRIVELRQGKLFSYSGNYTRFLELRAMEDEAWRKAYSKQQEYIHRTEEYIRRFKAGIKSKQARGRQLQLERLERIEKPAADTGIGSWNIKLRQESGQDVLILERVNKAFDDFSVLEAVNLEIKKGDRIALVGPNGSGKSTLLKIIAGRLKPDSGKVSLGSRVIMGYFSQEYEDLDDDKTVLDELICNFDINLEQARSYLGRMLFSGDDVFKNIKDLSGGEKGRLAILKLILSGANFLVLDEPTNHLDIKSRQVVEDILESYPGTILVVSHDRYFLDQIVTSVVAVEDKTLVHYWGNFSEYQVKRKEVIKNKAGEIATAKEKGEQYLFRIEQKAKEKAARRLEKRLKEIELQIEELEEKKVIFEKNFSEPYSFDSTTFLNMSQEYEQIKVQLDILYDGWQQVMEDLEMSFAQG